MRRLVELLRDLFDSPVSSVKARRLLIQMSAVKSTVKMPEKACVRAHTTGTVR